MAKASAARQHSKISSPEGRNARRQAGMTAWLVSLVVHVLLFALMVSVPWITRAGDGTPTVTAAQIQHDQPKVRTQMKPEKPPEEHRLVVDPSRPIKPKLDKVSPDTKDEPSSKLSVIGIGTGGGEFAKYGMSASSSGAPKFFGLGPETRAVRNIVYVVDRSASMAVVFEDLQKELKRSLSRLRKSQRFHILFYSSSEPLAFPPGKMINAIQSAKDEAFEFIDNVPYEGGTNELPALQQAFALKPDIIYFLSDGDLFDRDLLLAKLDEWNSDRRVRIFTIAYVFSDGKELLRKIARDHGGMFRFVSEYDLE